MDTLFAAEQLTRSRAAALAYETEMRRSLADRGIVLRPEPPIVAVAHRAARMLTRMLRPGRIPTARAAQ